MGFLEINENKDIAGGSGTLDLVGFEKKFLQRFNDEDVLLTNYKAVEFGIAFDKRKKESKVYLYEGGEEITICPEPLVFIREFDDVSDNMYEADILFREKMKSFQKILLDKKPVLRGREADSSRMWMNKTLTGINLRPGNRNADPEDFTPVRMCDDNVHGLIVGRTGSGKSVYINALILSLITEYAPWELDLFLADFKKVELSRYMNDKDERNGGIAFTPQINACAATSEIRYVTSLIKYLVDCMNARNEFFTRLGVTKIQEFREKYNLVLPRVLLIVDEFQQLFSEATNREAEEIQVMLNSITKLGRATGFHLIFASQEMSGTLRGNTLANFKIRMALPCNQQISVDILGNKQAVNLERGYVLVNTESGDELQNIKYRVPFIETDKKDDDVEKEKTPFYKYLDEIKLAGSIYDLRYKTNVQKFYREELQESEKDFIADLERIRKKKNRLVLENRSIYDGIVLGKTVLYSIRKNDKVSCYIEKGRNKNVMIATPSPDDAARIRKLIAENLLRTDEPTYHIGMELNNLIWERYRFDKEIHKLNENKFHEYQSCDAETGVKYLQMIYYLRLYTSEYLSGETDEFQTAGTLEDTFVKLLSDAEERSAYRKYAERRKKLMEEIGNLAKEIESESNITKKGPANPIVEYLERCSREIILIPKHGTKADFAGLRLYKTIISNFNINLDVLHSAEKNIQLIESKLKELTEKDNLAILQYRILRRAILYYIDCFEGRIPEKTTVSDTLEICYSYVKAKVKAYKAECELKKEADTNITEKKDRLRRKQNELDEMNLEPDKVYMVEQELSGYLNSFIKQVYEKAYGKMGIRKNYPEAPHAEYVFDEGRLLWRIANKGINKIVEDCLNNILDIYMRRCAEGNFDSNLFRKNIFWINGLDEIDRIPNSIVDILGTAINLNILVIAIITSELKDTMIRKAFDYAFVTGNIEKFYTMFNIRYTKQALDSIVVNFGVRSKGIDLPFKMYKSNLDDVQAPNFIDGLLDE